MTTSVNAQATCTMPMTNDTMFFDVVLS